MTENSFIKSQNEAMLDAVEPPTPAGSTSASCSRNSSLPSFTSCQGTIFRDIERAKRNLSESHSSCSRLPLEHELPEFSENPEVRSRDIERQGKFKALIIQPEVKTGENDSSHPDNQRTVETFSGFRSTGFRAVSLASSSYTSPSEEAFESYSGKNELKYWNERNRIDERSEISQPQLFMPLERIKTEISSPSQKALSVETSGSYSDNKDQFNNWNKGNHRDKRSDISQFQHFMPLERIKTEISRQEAVSKETIGSHSDNKDKLKVRNKRNLIGERSKISQLQDFIPSEGLRTEISSSKSQAQSEETLELNTSDDVEPKEKYWNKRKLSDECQETSQLDNYMLLKRFKGAIPSSRRKAMLDSFEEPNAMSAESKGEKLLDTSIVMEHGEGKLTVVDCEANVKSEFMEVRENYASTPLAGREASYFPCDKPKCELENKKVVVNDPNMNSRSSLSLFENSSGNISEMHRNYTDDKDLDNVEIFSLSSVKQNGNFQEFRSVEKGNSNTKNYLSDNSIAEFKNKPLNLRCLDETPENICNKRQGNLHLQKVIFEEKKYLESEATQCTRANSPADQITQIVNYLKHSNHPENVENSEIKHYEESLSSSASWVERCKSKCKSLWESVKQVPPTDEDHETKDEERMTCRRLRSEQIGDNSEYDSCTLEEHHLLCESVHCNENLNQTFLTSNANSAECSLFLNENKDCEDDEIADVPNVSESSTESEDSFVTSADKLEENEILKLISAESSSISNEVFKDDDEKMDIIEDCSSDMRDDQSSSSFITSVDKLEENEISRLISTECSDISNELCEDDDNEKANMIKDCSGDKVVAQSSSSASEKKTSQCHSCIQNSSSPSSWEDFDSGNSIFNELFQSDNSGIETLMDFTSSIENSSNVDIQQSYSKETSTEDLSEFARLSIPCVDLTEGEVRIKFDLPGEETADSGAKSSQQDSQDLNQTFETRNLMQNVFEELYVVDKETATTVLRTIADSSHSKGATISEIAKRVAKQSESPNSSKLRQDIRRFLNAAAEFGVITLADYRYKLTEDQRSKCNVRIAEKALPVSSKKPRKQYVVARSGVNGSRGDASEDPVEAEKALPVSSKKPRKKYVVPRSGSREDASEDPAEAKVTEQTVYKRLRSRIILRKIAA